MTGYLRRDDGSLMPVGEHLTKEPAMSRYIVLTTTKRTERGVGMAYVAQDTLTGEKIGLPTNLKAARKLVRGLNRQPGLW